MILKYVKNSTQNFNKDLSESVLTQNVYYCVSKLLDISEMSFPCNYILITIGILSFFFYFYFVLFFYLFRESLYTYLDIFCTRLGELIPSKSIHLFIKGIRAGIFSSRTITFSQSSPRKQRYLKQILSFVDEDIQQ